MHYYQNPAVKIHKSVVRKRRVETKSNDYTSRLRLCVF